MKSCSGRKARILRPITRFMKRTLPNRLRKVIHDPASPVNRFLDKKAVLQFLESPKDYGKPWYGQLMAGPQMMAYLLQINFWLKEYQISIEL